MVVLIFSILILIACKKDEATPVLSLPSPQRVVEIIGVNSDVMDYKQTFSYEENLLSSYDHYRRNELGEWVIHAKFFYEYPASDIIIEIEHEKVDTMWVPSSKWEKQFTGDKQIEGIRSYFHVESSSWYPTTKVSKSYEQDKLTEVKSFLYKNDQWEEAFKRTYTYENGVWMGFYSLFKHDGIWDSTSKWVLEYAGNQIIRKNNYSYQSSQTWSLNSQILLDYENDRLSDMSIYFMWSDSLYWSRSYVFVYNENRNPVSYILDYSNHAQESIDITYESGSGNYQQAVEESIIDPYWLWFPRPVKK